MSAKQPVSERALFQRINRALNHEDERLRVARGSYYYESNCSRTWLEDRDLGRYYQVDLCRNALIDTHVDLEALGRELRVLRPWEQLADKTS
jgi:hypothetical protein